MLDSQTKMHVFIDCEMPIQFPNISRPFRMTSACQMMPNKLVNSQTNCEWNISNFVASAVPADSQAYLIVPFHNDFSPIGEQLEQRKLAHTL